MYLNVDLNFFSNAVDEIATSIIYCFLWLICKYWNVCINVHCCWNLNSFDSIFLPQNLFHGRKDLKSPPHLKYKRINVSINHPNSTAHSSYGSTVISADTCFSLLVSRYFYWSNRVYTDITVDAVNFLILFLF